MSARCEVNIAGREEDCGSTVAYVPCRKPAVADARSPRSAREYYVCEEHAADAENAIVSRFDDDAEVAR